jgi:hypothetical protein
MTNIINAPPQNNGLDCIDCERKEIESTTALFEACNGFLSQSRIFEDKLMLEQVGHPESNTNLRAPDSLKNKENDTGCRFAEDKDKSFDEDSTRAKRA